MDAHFNLVDKPWLPCVQANGEPVELGLYDALAQAHTLRELHGETPLGTAALHRLLLAVLHRIFGPESHGAWSQLWRKRRWDEAALQDYFDRWRHRFNLFDDEYPFYQSPDPPGDPEPLNRLSLPYAYNSTLFEHQIADGSLSVLAAQAARWLVTLQASSIGTGPPSNPYPAGPLVNSMIVMPHGQTLFETLAFNLIEYHDDKPIQAPEDREDKPIWEYDRNPFPPNPKTFYLPGYLEYLTWQCRTIRLLPVWEEGQIRVRECYLSQGARWDNRQIEDPMKVYVKDEKWGMVPLRLREGRAMWRDAHALFRFHEPKNVRPPLAFKELSEHTDPYWGGDLEPSQTYNYVTLGLCNTSAKLHFFRHERMPLALTYLVDETLSEKLRDALRAAEGVGTALRRAGWELAQWVVSPADRGEAHREDTQLVFSQLSVERRYWSRLEVKFQGFVRDLPQDRQAALDDWLKTLQQTARNAFTEATEGISDPIRGLKAITLARGTLERLMARALEPEE
jgi:CRISPR system Cascade subunit CasA